MSTDTQETNDSQRWIDRIETSMNACSLEVLRDFYPPNLSNSKEDKMQTGEKPLVIGCYQLDESESSTAGNRDGQLRLYMVNTDEKNNDQSYLSFSDPRNICKTEAGVLDGKWFQRCPINIQQSCNESNLEQSQRRHLFASASASGKVWLHALNTNPNADPFMEPLVSSSSDDDAERICLALDLDESNININSGSGSAKIISSYSDGTLAVHSVSFPENQLLSNGKISIVEEARWHGHSLFRGRAPAEVWSCCWAKIDGNTHSSDLILSGGDDCTLKGWDLRLPLCPTKPIFQIGEEEHGAGVTTISWHPSNSNIFASGSYDEGVRVWDIRCMKSNSSTSGGGYWCGQPKKLAKIDSCGGGIWRLKWHPHDPAKILVGAMHGGCRVLHVPALQQSNDSNEHNETINIISKFTAHESMAYGADWLVASDPHEENEVKAGTDIAASCSFYDQKAFIWRTV